MAGASEAWLPIATLVLGYSLNIIRDWMRARQLRLREQDAREFKLKERAKARMEEFQRKAFIDLQEDIQRYYKLLDDPPMEPEFRASWFAGLRELRMKMLTATAAVDDPAMVDSIQKLCEVSESMEKDLAGIPSHGYENDVLDPEWEAAKNCLQDRFLQANRRIMQLKRDRA